MRKVEVDQALGCRESGDNANAGAPERGDDQQEPALIGAPDAGPASFSIDGFGFEVERIVIKNLFSLLGRDLVASQVIAISIVPLKSKLGIQIPL